MYYVRFLRHSVTTFIGPQFETLILLDLERFVLPRTLRTVLKLPFDTHLYFLGPLGFDN